MANPANVDRVNPSTIANQIHLRDGHRTLITFQLRPAIALWEKTVKPWGYDGGDKIPQTTMHNVRRRTFSPRSLIEVTDSTMTVTYDPNVVGDIDAIINVVQGITITHPDLTQESEWGWLKSFEPSENQEGEQPEAQVVICFSGYDPTHGNNYVESTYTLDAVPGT